MEELSKQFYGSFAVAEDPNDPARPHPRFSQYKLKQEGYGDQDVRRKRMLEEQKDRRRDAIDFVRKIAEDQLWDDDDMEEEGREIKQGIRDCGNRDVRIVGFDEVDCTSHNNCTIVISQFYQQQLQ